MAKAIVLFYCSPKFGSEYRFGWEYLRFAVENLDYDTVIISDIRKNIKPDEIHEIYPSLKCILIRSIVKSDRLLRKFTDFIPQVEWHSRTMRHLLSRELTFCTIWVATGAQPWLPVKHYIRMADGFVWGPIGGGEPINHTLSVTSLSYFKVRELVRNMIVRITTNAKRKTLLAGASDAGKDIFVLARTTHSHKLFQDLSSKIKVEIFPEILTISKKDIIDKNAKQNRVPYLWVGQDIARKNLSLGIKIYREVSRRFAKIQQLEIYGVGGDADTCNGRDLKYHGWVGAVPWARYRGAGIFVLSSSREGVPSALLEAFQAGCFCIVPDVGAISRIFDGNDRVFIYNHQEIVDNKDIFDQMAAAINSYLALSSVHVPHISFEKSLYEFLKNGG